MTHDYVEVLENRVAWLEAFLDRLKSVPSKERDSLLATVTFDDHLSEKVQSGQNQKTLSLSDTRCMQYGLQPEANTLLYHGPTSIYPNELVSNQIKGVEQLESSVALTGKAPTERRNYVDVAQHFGIDMDGPAVTDALLYFFKWQYPHFMFIYREAFLRDHFCNPGSGKYWSCSLLFAVCALGALMMEDDLGHGTSERFFGAAESILIVSGLSQPCITTVQAFLCLAFYEIGRGNLSKGWSFSGNVLVKFSCVTTQLTHCRNCLSHGSGSWIPTRPKSLGYARHKH